MALNIGGSIKTQAQIDKEKRTHSLPELLAPAGSMAALRAAIAAGADAVYLGGPNFNARAYAENFSLAELAAAVDYAHLRGVKVHVTVNTLVADAELPEAAAYLKELYTLGVDAVLLQDLGLATLARRLLPDLPLHASTQMTVHNAEAVRLLAEIGFQRVVLARELSLEEIRAIVAATPLEVEVFIHGALCFSYSGQCLMSSLIGGRSGNRGRCAQPCRLPYALVPMSPRPGQQGERAAAGPTARPLREGYLLSTRDLWTLAHLPELVESGVTSLKIEGRMKRPEYVATVVSVYRAALDRYAAAPESTPLTREAEDLIQIFNRGFTTGYFFGRPGRALMNYQRPNNRGRQIGRVLAFTSPGGHQAGQALIELSGDLRVGDGIEVWVSRGGRAGTTVKEMYRAAAANAELPPSSGERRKRREKHPRPHSANHGYIPGSPCQEAGPGERVWVRIQGQIRPGDRVFKTFDARLMAAAARAQEGEPRPVPLTMHASLQPGAPFRLTVTDPQGHTATATSTIPCRPAEKHPLTEETLKEHLLRLGNTPYRVATLTIDLAPGLMVPWSVLNQVRRQAVEALSAQRLRRRQAPAAFEARLEACLHGNAPLNAPLFPGRMGENHPLLAVTVATLEGARAALAAGADLLYLDMEGWRQLPPLELAKAVRLAKEAGIPVYLGLPRIIHAGEREEIRQYLQQVQDLGVAGFRLGNLGLFPFPEAVFSASPASTASSPSSPACVADYPLNIFNHLTAAFFASQGATVLTLSPELTLAQIRALLSSPHLAEITAECLVQGPLTLMVSEHCVLGSALDPENENPPAEDRDDIQKQKEQPRTTLPSYSLRQCHTLDNPPCRRGTYGLRDRLGITFPLYTNRHCRTHLLNAMDLCLIEHFPALLAAGVRRLRLENQFLPAAGVETVTRIWREELDLYLAAPAAYTPNPEARARIEAATGHATTRGHYFRGVL